MNHQIPVNVPFVDLTRQHQPLQAEFDRAIQAVVRGGDFILGQALAEFEAAFAAACGVRHGIGVASGTDAIALGLQACGIGAGDEAILPANTFIATLIGVLRTGATPVLVDCDPNTALIDLDAAARAVTPQTKVILPVHLYGQMVSPRQLLDFAKTYQVSIFEDAAQAHLAQREGYRAGSVGKGAAFSLYPSKNLGAFGDGGIAMTNEDTVAEMLRSLRNYGAPRKYFHSELGTNSRLDTVQAAVLNIKLPHLARWNAQRNQIAQQYDTQLASLQRQGIFSLQNCSGTGHVYHLYVIRIAQTCPLSRQTIQEKLSQKGIQTGIHYPIPCHLQPAYEFLGYKAGDFPHAETLSQEILSLPMYPGMSTTEIELVVDSLQSLFQTRPAAVISG